MKSELAAAVLAQSHELQLAAASIVQAEAKSEHTITAIWRPVLMLTITAILANNYLIGPILQSLFGWSVTLELPSQLWTLLTIGVGGYVGSRGAEKIARTFVMKGEGDG